MHKTTRSSDSFYHRLFAHPGMVEDLLAHFLDASLLAELNLSKMRRHNTKFTSFQGVRRRGDVVWEIPFRAGGSLFLLLILEFQSTVDPWTALRVNVYTGLLHQQLIAERRMKPSDGLPPVLALVLYNGETRWNAPPSLREMINLPKDSALWPFQPEMRYYPLDEGRLPEESLQGNPALSAILFRLEHSSDPGSMLQAGRDVMAWFEKHPDGPPVKHLFNELLFAGLQRLRLSDPVPPIPEDLQEMVAMLNWHVEKWAREYERIGEQRGELRGEQRGELRGELRGERSLLLRLLNRRFGSLPESVRQRLDEADGASLETWGERLLEARSLDEVFGE
ncbi:MAG: Rpn family recombination-promoting nuclease/putative transposase [Magnetococcales bacterium]|nr:Rpn family recombination-promoting nuclease/putative transposase [Magnetococcales bacterium]